MGNSRVSLCVALGSLALPVLASWDAEAQSNSGAEPAGQGSVKVAQADDQSGSGLQEVVVTAQFRAESLQSTPLAITAISGATLLEKGITDVTGLGQVAPNVSLTSTGAYGGKTVAAFIRGIGAGDYNYNVEPGVAFYVDDVYLGPSYGTMLNLIDLDRVEVLRGPQGTLSGKNAIGGAVHLVTQKPKGDGSGYAQVEGGSYNLLRVRAAYDATLIDNTLFARVSGYSSHRDGYVSLLDFACENPTEVGNTSAPYGLKNSQPRQGCKRGTLGGDDVHAARVQFRWTPVENFEANLSADYVDDDSEGAADVLIGMNPGAFTNFNNNTAIPLYGVPYDTRFLPPNHYSSYATFDDKQHGLSFAPVNSLLTKDITLNTDWTISPNLKLTTISAWRKYLGHWSYDSDSSPLATDSVYDTQQHEQYSEEVRLSGVNFSDRLNWTVGGFYYNAHERDTADVMAALYNYFNSHDDPAKDEAYAAFVHSEFKLTDTLTAIGGLRESRESKDFVFNNQDIPGTGANSFPGGLIKPTSTSFSHMDYRFGLQNQFTATFMAYANVSTGFRSGGFNPKPSTAGQVIPYGPEKLTSYELGTRNEFFDRRVRFNNTIYYGSYKDIQLTARLVDTGTGFPANIVTNAGAAKIYGYESELNADVNSLLTLTGTGSYTHFKYTSLGLAAGLTSGPTLNTMQVHTPKWKSNLGAQLNLPWFASYGKLTFNADFSWQSLQFEDQPNSPQLQVPAYGLLNGRLSFATVKNWTISLAGTNITNKFYYSTKNFISGSNQWKGVPGVPAEWDLTVRKDF